MEEAGEAAPAPEKPDTPVTSAQETGQGEDDAAPDQYTDPLAGEDDDQAGAQQGQDAAAPPVAAPVVPTTTAAQLPRTGKNDPSPILVIIGGGLLATGLALWLFTRRRDYQYPYPRY